MQTLFYEKIEDQLSPRNGFRFNYNINNSLLGYIIVSRYEDFTLLYRNISIFNNSFEKF